MSAVVGEDKHAGVGVDAFERGRAWARMKGRISHCGREGVNIKDRMVRGVNYDSSKEDNGFARCQLDE